MKCTRPEKELSLFVLELLPPVKAAALEHHLTVCPRCRERVASLGNAVQHLRPLSIQPPAFLAERVVSSASSRRLPVRWTGWWLGPVLATGVLLALVMLNPVKHPFQWTNTEILQAYDEDLQELGFSSPTYASDAETIATASWLEF